MLGRQLSARSGTVACELKGDRVELAGDCELILSAACGSERVPQPSKRGF
jgi:hypothetical protein